MFFMKKNDKAPNSFSTIRCNMEIGAFCKNKLYHVPFGGITRIRFYGYNLS